ncbi:MAG: hypothetical protein QN210_12320 [Armatimonadota bacterium]|nr:hypothetical protein [Armatimonadota bacterium]
MWMRSLDFRFLPFPGGLADQPLDLLEDIVYLESLWGFYERQERERMSGPAAGRKAGGMFHDMPR